MFEHPDAPTLQRRRVEQAAIALPIAVTGRDAAVLHRPLARRHHLTQRRGDSGLIGLGDLAGRHIELQPVAIGRDVAARHHDRRSAQRHGVERQGRGRQHAAIDRHQPGRPDRCSAVGDDGRARGAQIASQIDAPSGHRADMGEKRGRVTARRATGEIDRETAQAAGAKLQRIRHAALPWRALGGLRALPTQRRDKLDCRSFVMGLAAWASGEAPINVSFIPQPQSRAMQIQKRTMNWLPRASLYDEAETARLKRRAQAQSDLATSANNNATLISTGISNTGESINLTLRIGAARIQAGTTKKV